MHEKREKPSPLKTKLREIMNSRRHLPAVAVLLSMRCMQFSIITARVSTMKAKLSFHI
jgi:hypothetical protein